LVCQGRRQEMNTADPGGSMRWRPTGTCPDPRIWKEERVSPVRVRLRTFALPLSIALMAAVIAFGSAPAAHAAGFGPPTKVTDLNGGEPGVDVGPDGTIYVNAPSG